MASSDGISPTVLIADDSSIFRSALRDFLTAKQLNVIAEASSGAEAVRLTRELAPNIVFMDLRMPGMSGLEACRRIRDASTNVQVILISAHLPDAASERTGAGPWTVVSKQELLAPNGVETLIDKVLIGPSGPLR